MPIAESFFQVLKTICTRLNDTDVIWAVTGSLGFALHGMEITINDIDLQTDQCGAYQIERRFSEHLIHPVIFSSSEHIRSHYGEFCLDGINVEIMGDLQKRLPNGQWEAPVNIRLIREEIPYNGLIVPVLSLSYEYQAYKKLGRFAKAELIRKHLEKL